MYLTKTAFCCKQKVTTNSLSSSPSSQLDISPVLQKYLNSCVYSKHCHCERSRTTQITSMSLSNNQTKVISSYVSYPSFPSITNNKHSRQYKSDFLQSMQMTTTPFSSLTNTKAHPTNLQQASPHSIPLFFHKQYIKGIYFFSSAASPSSSAVFLGRALWTMGRRGGGGRMPAYISQQ